MKATFTILTFLFSLQLFAQVSVPPADLDPYEPGNGTPAPLPPADCNIFDVPACTIKQTDSCITDKVTVAMSPGADAFPGGAILNSFEFTRINEKMIHAKVAQYYFPQYKDRVQVIIEKDGDFNGLTRYRDISYGILYLFDCNKGFIYTIGSGASVERLDIE